MAIEIINVGTTPDDNTGDFLRDAFLKTNKNFIELYTAASGTSFVVNGTSGTSGSSGVFGTSGTSGTSGVSGTSGRNGTSGTDGVSGTDGASGSSGRNGTSGSSGSSGATGVAGTSGTSGTSGSNGVPVTTYNLKIYRSDIVWSDDWIKIIHTESLNLNRNIINVSLKASFGYGIISLSPIINYPASDTNSSAPFFGFYVKDSDGLITTTSDFEYIELSYNIAITTDNIYKYDCKKPVLGENAVNTHNSGDAWHSEKNQVIFQYVAGTGFTNNYTSYQTCYDPIAQYTLLNQSFIPTYVSLKDANMLYTPYVDAAAWREVGSNPNVISVGSHYDNTFRQVDIMPRPSSIAASAITVTDVSVLTFLDNAVAVAARLNDITTMSGTSYGYGLEFIEDMSHESLDPFYPNKDIPSALAQVTTNSGGTIMTSQHNTGFTSIVGNVTIGERVTVYNTVIDAHEDTYVQEILGPSSIRVSPPVTPIVVDGIYIWHYIDLASYCGAQQQSWATPLIAGKLKYIKLETGASWQQIREASRLTAYRANVTDGSKWDIYRGFGVINVQSAITYINDTYKSVEYKKKLASELEGLQGINPFLDYSDILPHSPISKSMVDNKLGVLQEYADNATAIAAGLTIGSFYRTGDLLKVVH